ncbi:DNA alkylation repair protein [Candidatus Saccharibacteria bacterium oral taxon 488]|nr:DNA alkylation repair protein [Candidatus Saccharibacteria bacterium oral taxon 488]QLF51834.1 DNA alkylation repair protein [Candidatus Saccharibacteria bacterium oral taxon 488]
MLHNLTRQLETLAQGNETYAAFNQRIVNTKMPVIGVRVPDLRRLARELVPDMSAADISELLTAQNESFDYVLLCGLLITHARLDDQTMIDLAKQYLPRVDSWAHIDTFVEKKRRFAGEVWWDFALECLQNEDEFTVRYGVISLMTNFLDEAHIDQVFAALRNVRRDGYYVKMALAWLYATAAVHFFELTLAELENEHIDAWTRNKAYQKMRESRRFTPEEQRIIRQQKEDANDQQTNHFDSSNYQGAGLSPRLQEI